MRMLVLAAFISFPVAAADVRDNTSTKAAVTLGKQTNATFEFRGDRDWFRMQLVKGQDYIAACSPISSYYGTGMVLRDKNGREIKKSGCGYDDYQGFEFRAAYTGLHFLALYDPNPTIEDDIYPSPYKFAVGKDCAKDIMLTRCVAEVNKLHKGYLFSESDYDAVAIRLFAHRKYELTVDGSFYGFSLEDDKGKVLTEVEDNDYGPKVRAGDFVASRSGTHYIRVFSSYFFGGDYTILMRPK